MKIFEILNEVTTPDGGGSRDFQNIPNDSNQQIVSPIGTVQTGTEQQLRKIERENNIKVGSPAWFRLYSKPNLKGEKPIGDAPAPTVVRDIDRHKD